MSRGVEVVRGSLNWTLSISLVAALSLLAASCSSEEGAATKTALGGACTLDDECQSLYCGPANTCDPSGGFLQSCGAGCADATSCVEDLYYPNVDVWGICTRSCSSDADCGPGTCVPKSDTSTESFCIPRCTASIPGSFVCEGGAYKFCSSLPSSFCDTCGCKDRYACQTTHCEFENPLEPNDQRIWPIAWGREWVYGGTPGNWTKPPDGEVTFAITGLGCSATADEYPVTGSSSSGSSTSCVKFGSDPDQVISVDHGTPMLDVPVQEGHTWIGAYGTEWRYASAGQVTVPAGTFNDCWETRVFEKNEPQDTWNVWCRGVGKVIEHFGSAYELQLLRTNFLPGQTTY